MKKILNIILAITLTFVFTGCEDMLTVDSNDKAYTSANDTLYSYLGIMNCVQNIAERQVILGELRGDLVTTSQYVTDTLSEIANFENPQDKTITKEKGCSMLNIRDYYNIINNCNLYINNADTNLTKHNKHYLVPEYSQVCAIRAWTYLKLVENYGEVPYITYPIDDLDKATNFDYNNQNNMVNKNNLIDKVIATGLDKLVDIDYPYYGTYDNGAVSIQSRKLMFPVRLILADMYLLRGNSESDYRKAAEYYYEYLKKTSSITTLEYCSASLSRTNKSDGVQSFNYTTQGNWGKWAASYSSSSDYDEITQIPSSANKQFGTMLTRVADIYGYTPTSSQSSSTTESTDDSGNTTESTSTSGAISVSANYKAQVVPSNGYYTVSKQQHYINYIHMDATPTLDSLKCGDARYGVATSELSHEGDSYTLCSKASKGGTFYYTIPVYRKELVWLRFAEAINRAGFPEIAFAVLKDGLCKANFPVATTKTVKRYVTDPVTGDTLHTETGRDSTVIDTVPYLKLNADNAMYYVDSLELKGFNSWSTINFNDDVWIGNFGIHARGCGFGEWPHDSNNLTYYRTSLTGTHDSTYFDYTKMVNKYYENITTQYPDETDKQKCIDAVEDMIVDELALECAFEGNRFPDLIRIAEHKNLAGIVNGTQWLALKIACRDYRYNPYATDPGVYDPVSNKNEVLYNKLLDKTNWYFTRPK